MEGRDDGPCWPSVGPSPGYPNPGHALRVRTARGFRLRIGGDERRWASFDGHRGSRGHRKPRSSPLRRASDQRRAVEPGCNQALADPMHQDVQVVRRLRLPGPQVRHRCSADVVTGTRSPPPMSSARGGPSRPPRRARRAPRAGTGARGSRAVCAHTRSRRRGPRRPGRPSP